MHHEPRMNSIAERHIPSYDCATHVDTKSQTCDFDSRCGRALVSPRSRTQSACLGAGFAFPLLPAGSMPLLVAFVCALHSLRHDVRDVGCPKPASEITFNSIVHGLLNEPGAIPKGDMLDTGAHNFEWACMYACLAPNRTVRAVDPSARFVSGIKQKGCTKGTKGKRWPPNLHSYLGACVDGLAP